VLQRLYADLAANDTLHLWWKGGFGVETKAWGIPGAPTAATRMARLYAPLRCFWLLRRGQAEEDGGRRPPSLLPLHCAFTLLIAQRSGA